MFIPPTAQLLPPDAFESLIGQTGQRVSWMKGHACPCTFASAGPNGALPLPGSAVRGCTQCSGVGTYWDAPSLPFRAYISFMHLSTAPDEPGADMDESYGLKMRADPTITIPYTNPYLAPFDPGQPTTAWNQASLMDMFIPVDSLSRFTAVLQNGGVQNLPYQQNLSVAPSGAVNTWNPLTKSIVPVSGYVVSGASVLLPSGYAPGLNYMVEFTAAPLYVAFRHAGGLPHTRQFGGGAVNEPRRYRLQTLDYWTRQKGIQPTAPGSTTTGGSLDPQATGFGQAFNSFPVP